MIFSTLSQSDRYLALHPRFASAFEYIGNTDLMKLAPGRYDIVGDELFVIIEQVPARTREAAQLECHRRYIDIQLVLQGIDEMGWKPLIDCHNPVDEYREDHDIQFFRDTPAAWIATPPETFCIFFPEDAHAPLVGRGEIRKAIFKIKAD